MTTEQTNKTAEQTSQHLPEVDSLKFVHHTSLAKIIIERLRQCETKKKVVDAYLERSAKNWEAWEAWDKIREIFYEDIYDGIFLWPNECEEGQLEEIVGSCSDDKEKEFTKLVLAEYNILISELNKAECEPVFIGVNW